MKTSSLSIFAFTIFIATFYLASCDSSQPQYIEGNSNRIGDKEIRYFKDARTGLCFAERGYNDNYAFTCVPCDSVKQLIKNPCK